MSPTLSLSKGENGHFSLFSDLLQEQSISVQSHKSSFSFCHFQTGLTHLSRL